VNDTSLSVSLSDFISCRLQGDSLTIGGAIFAFAPSVTLMDNCAVECFAVHDAFCAVECPEPNSPEISASVHFLTVHECGDEVQTTAGGGLAWQGVGSISNVNFTNGAASVYGPGAAMRADGGSVKYANVVGCSGSSTLVEQTPLSGSAVPLSVEFSNFFSNTILALTSTDATFGTHGAAVFMATFPFSLSDCAFASNTNGYDCQANPFSPNGELQVIRCYFAGAVTSGHAMSVTLCVGSTATQFPVSGIASAYCAAPPAPRASAPFAASAVSLHTGGFTGSDAAGQSRDFAGTAAVGTLAIPAITAVAGSAAIPGRRPKPRQFRNALPSPETR
jgi:hypothetical protein